MPQEESFSRGVEYDIDEGRMEIEQIWEYGENIESQLFSPFICDADWMPTTGNVLLTFGAVGFTGGVSSFDLGLVGHDTVADKTVEPAAILGNVVLESHAFDELLTAFQLHPDFCDLFLEGLRIAFLAGPRLQDFTFELLFGA